MDKRNKAADLFPCFTVLLLFFLCLLPNTEAANLEVSSVQMTVGNLEQAVAFYQNVLRFQPGKKVQGPGSTFVTMRLGEEYLVLNCPDQRGATISTATKANDRNFQHIAIVVSDMKAAHRRLLDHGVKIVSFGPQKLPLWNFDAGNIRALYFRDPEGHFLELIQFPSDKGEPKWQRKNGPLFLGFDHTAMVVRDLEASRHFYRDILGFTLTGESFNYGGEQEALSGVPGARVKIDSFRGVKGPGIELLQYLSPGTESATAANPSPQDIGYWQINVSSGPATEGLVFDPDGHPLNLTPAFNSWHGQMREAFRQHWPRYLMEGAELGIFMVIALYFTLALEHPESPLRRAISSELLRRFLMGVAIGVTVMVLIYCPWGRQSGAQFNPAVTLARLSLNRIEPWDTFFYIVFQFVGGWLFLELAGYPLKRFAAHPQVKWVVTEPKKKGMAAAWLAEFIISFLIFFSLLLVVHFPSLKWWIGVVAGIHLCAFITFEAPFSGMSLNPARTLASAIPARSWKALWIYFMAPPLAMLLAAGVCRWLIDS